MSAEPLRTENALVHVVDDDEAVRDSLRFLLELEGLQVRTYPAAKSLLDAELANAGCIVSDFRMPGMDGLQMLDALRERGVPLPIIIMTAHGEVPIAVRAMRSGAVDFLEKPFGDREVLEAVQRALAQNRRELASRAQAEAAARRLAQLTPREREVLEKMVEGKSTKEIARELGTSPRTIDVHRARVVQKLDVESLPDLVRLVLASQAA